jgi:cell division protein FtsN
MAGPGKKNPFLSGFLLGLFAGLALAVVVALMVTRNNPFTDARPARDTGNATDATKPTAPSEAPKYEFYQALPGGQPGAMPAEPAGLFSASRRLRQCC